jgi:hypothetical protein
VRRPADPFRDYVVARKTEPENHNASTTS